MLRVVAATLTVMLVPTFLMGLLFPIAARIHASEMRRLGRRIGSIYAGNTGGAILGAFTAGFVWIPLVGTQRTILLLAAINLAIGATVLLLDPRVPRRRTVAVGGAAALIVIAALALPDSFLAGRFARGGAALLYYDETTAGTVTVQGLPDGGKVLRVNGAGEVPTDDDSIRTFRLLGSLPLLLHAEPREVLVVAFGGGITLATVEAHGPDRIECVEMVPAVVGAADHFADYNREVYRRLDGDPIELIFDDGRNHLLRTERRYDVIVADATHPGTSDSWVLYTADFYHLTRQRLRAGGMLAQWLPLHGLTPDDYRTILRTFRVHYPHASVWLTPGYTVLLGATEPVVFDFERIASRLAVPR